MQFHLLYSGMGVHATSDWNDEKVYFSRHFSEDRCVDKSLCFAKRRDELKCANFVYLRPTKQTSEFGLLSHSEGYGTLV